MELEFEVSSASAITEKLKDGSLRRIAEVTCEIPEEGEQLQAEIDDSEERWFNRTRLTFRFDDLHEAPPLGSKVRVTVEFGFK